MKLYLSSIGIPTPDDLAQLIGKPLTQATVALIPNAKDYYADRPRGLKVAAHTAAFEALGLTVAVVDLRDYHDTEVLATQLQDVDVIWGMGGNTFMLRYEMARSGFDRAIVGLLESGIVYGGDSAGALVAGTSIAGVESADPPEFAEQVMDTGLGLVPYTILPHTDNPEFAQAVSVVRAIHADKTDLMELMDAQAVIFDGDDHRIVQM